jgi:SAM-dependent methyltransferase
VPRICAWCGRPIDSSATRLAGRVQCNGCGVANTDPWPTEDQLDAAYGSWYRPAAGRFSGLGDAILRRTRGRLAHRLDRIAPPGPVLDVGAGDGALLDALAARGRRALGLERESRRSDVRAARLADVDGEWAAIVFWHSLEHLPNPGEEVERAASLLAPEGVLVIAVPNAASLQALLFGDRWLALDLPRHLVHLPAVALIERLRSLGLNVERVSYWRGGQVVFGWLHGLVGALPGRPELYDAIRHPDARRRPISAPTRTLVLAAATALAPLAAAAAVAEVLARRGGTVYLEARRA